MPKRVLMQVELTPAAKELVVALCNRNGMTQIALMSRVTEWFARQDSLIQAAILGHYPVELETDIAKLILKKISQKTIT